MCKLFGLDINTWNPTTACILFLLYRYTWYHMTASKNIIIENFNQRGDISTLKGGPLKLVDKFTNLKSSVSSTEKDIDTRLAKAGAANDRLSLVWKSNLTNKIKRSFFQPDVVSILLYGCTTWTLTKRMEKNLTAITQECCKQYWTSPGGNNLQNSSCTATYHLSRKLSKWDEPDMQDAAGEIRTNS